MPVVALLAAKIARCRKDTEITMPWYHMVHRLKLNRVALQTGWTTIDEGVKSSPLIYTHPADTRPAGQKNAFMEAECAANPVVVQSFVKPRWRHITICFSKRHPEGSLLPHHWRRQQ
jgi:hypothetical protein